MTELCSSTTKVIDHTSVRLSSLESTMPSVVVANEAAPLRSDVRVILEEPHALSNEIDLRLSGVGE